MVAQIHHGHSITPYLHAANLDIEVGDRIRVRRKDLGISQSSVAVELGITFGQIQKYENGSNRIGAGRLSIMAEFLGVPIESFFEETGESDISSARVANAEEVFLLDNFRLLADVDARSSVMALMHALAKPRRSPVS